MGLPKKTISETVKKKNIRDYAQLSITIGILFFMAVVAIITIFETAKTFLLDFQPHIILAVSLVLVLIILLFSLSAIQKSLSFIRLGIMSFVLLSFPFLALLFLPSMDWLYKSLLVICSIGLIALVIFGSKFYPNSVDEELWRIRSLFFPLTLVMMLIAFIISSMLLSLYFHQSTPNLQFNLQSSVDENVGSVIVDCNSGSRLFIGSSLSCHPLTNNDQISDFRIVFTNIYGVESDPYNIYSMNYSIPVATSKITIRATIDLGNNSIEPVKDSVEYRFLSVAEYDELKLEFLRSIIFLVAAVLFSIPVMMQSMKYLILNKE